MHLPKAPALQQVVSFHSIQRSMHEWILGRHTPLTSKNLHTPSPKMQIVHHSHRYLCWSQQSLPGLRSQHGGGKALSDSKRDEGFISSSTSGAGELWSKAGYPSAAVRVTVESLCSHTHPCRPTLCLGIRSHPQHAVWQSPEFWEAALKAVF